jgi:aryl-alcohol dehydrogenase-like predicted oxidoreductase
LQPPSATPTRTTRSASSTRPSTPERRGLARFRTEQPPYSILNRGINREVLPLAERFGMGTLVWGPFRQGLLTGRVRKGQGNTLRRAKLFKHLTDERRLDVVEQLIPIIEEAGMPMTHLAIAFTIAHPDVTSALLGPRTMEHLDDLLAGVDVVLTDDLLDRIDAIVPPGTDVGALDQEYMPPRSGTRTCAGGGSASAAA